MDLLKLHRHKLEDTGSFIEKYFRSVIPLLMATALLHLLLIYKLL
uniref:Uncharacterized protein n=1 Tax=Anguilla anguilla TaxID=7936 RepID=A0A0E9S504_ANGAN